MTVGDAAMQVRDAPLSKESAANPNASTGDSQKRHRAIMRESGRSSNVNHLSANERQRPGAKKINADAGICNAPKTVTIEIKKMRDGTSTARKTLS